MKRTMMAACILSLVACGGSKDDVATDQRQDWESRVQSLVYSFPDNAQQQVPTSSPVVLRFSSPVRTGNAALMDDIVLRDAAGDRIAWDEIEEVDNGQSLLLHPAQKLSPLTTYTLNVPTIELSKGETKARTISFTTRAAQEGPKSLVAEEEFRVLRTLPNDLVYGETSTPVDVVEFTTFRVQFSQPLDRSSVVYGGGSDATLQLTGPNGLVDAHVIVSGPYLTIDPKDDLQAGVEHKLTFTTGLKSVYGDSMPGGSFGNDNDPIAKVIEFTPKATGERGNMVQDIANTLGKTSPLTGRQINEVPMASVLLGEDTATQAHGIVAAELAFVPHFPDATPLRVKRGSLIEGASIDVLIGGEVPAGFESGTVRMDFLSDATGYLLPNPYSNADDAPRQVRLWMDVAVSTETPAANGAITQDLLHIELVGTSLVEDGRMVINAVGVVEPNVLGSEYASGLLSFYMEEVEDQDNPPVIVVDTTGPVLQSWIPGENAHLHKPGDPIIFNFNEAIDPESVKGKVRLFHNDNPMEIDYYVDGSALVIKPKYLFSESDFGATRVPVSILNYSPVESPNIYKVKINNGIVDLSGNPAHSFPFVQQFELARVVDNANVSQYMPNGAHALVPVSRREAGHSPLIIAAYPGFPCVLLQEFYDEQGGTQVDATRDLSLEVGKAGRCSGGHSGIDNIDQPDIGTPSDIKEMDDIIPVASLPENHPIIVSFSEGMNASSIVLGGTFLVEKIEDNGDVVTQVKGDLLIEDKYIRFTPYEGWEKDQLYRYTLRSAGYDIQNFLGGVGARMVANSNYQCGADAVCDLDGDPVQTQAMGMTVITPFPGAPLGGDRDYSILSTGPALKAGGPDFSQFFRGAEKRGSVIQFLTTSPTSDTNSNFTIEHSNIGTAGTVAGMPFPFPGEFDFPVDEPGTPNEYLMPGDIGYNPLYEIYDPNGMQAPLNSAKILSRHRNSDIESKLYSAGPASVLGVNVGCSYDILATFIEVGDPLVCPEHKFTHLVSSLVAEVTDDVVNGAVKVNMWPSIVVGTSVDIYALQSIAGAPLLPYAGMTGKQILRMRYSGVDRSQPIEAWIHSREDGTTILDVDLELYVEAPYAAAWGIGSESNRINLRSYEINMKMQGEVRFLDDGRMMVEQFNLEPVDILMKLHDGSGRWIGYADLFIPEYGARLNYISDPIK